MKVSEKDVAYVAELANLELTDDERAGMVRDLNSILEYVDRLNELDTSDVPPMAQVLHRDSGDESKQGSARFAYASRGPVHDEAERGDVRPVASSASGLFASSWPKVLRVASASSNKRGWGS